MVRAFTLKLRMILKRYAASISFPHQPTSLGSVLASLGESLRFVYFISRYRPIGEAKWETLPVTPPGSTRITIRNLNPGKTYQFQIVGINDLGEGHPSEIVNVTTKGNLPSI